MKTSEELEEEFFQYRWDHPMTFRSWACRRMAEIQREAAEEMRGLCLELIEKAWPKEQLREEMSTLLLPGDE